MFALAQMLRLGICGVQRDSTAAAKQCVARLPHCAVASNTVRRYAGAAQQQHAAACSNLGAMLEHGLGVAQDLQEALRMYDRAAALGNSVARDNSATLQRKMQDPQSTFPKAAPVASSSAASAAVLVPAEGKYAPTEDEAFLLR
jgi:TPR repeat protein